MSLPTPPRDGPAGVPPEHLHAIRDVAARLGRTVFGEPAPVPHGAINHNYRVETAGGPVFVRIHRDTRDRARVGLEQRVAAHAGSRGVPVIAPLRDAVGAASWSAGGLLVSAYPWVEGRHLQRGAITPPEAERLGALHGQVHVALADCEDPGLEISGQMHWDTEQAIADLSRVDDLIRYYPAPGEERLAIQRGLREQLALLESPVARASADFAEVPLRPCHGDFHDRNVLFDAGWRVLAVVDWEMASLLSPGYEMVRALAFMSLLEPPLVAAYLAGYRRHRPMPRDEFAAAVDFWWQHNLHSTWVYRRVFIEGDDRAAEFLPPGPVLVRTFADPAFRARLISLA